MVQLNVFFLLVLIVQTVSSISTKSTNETVQILLNLANYAVESRQNFGSNYPYQLPNHYQYNQKPPFGQYGLLQYPPKPGSYPQNFGHYPQFQRPHHQNNLGYPQNNFGYPQNNLGYPQRPFPFLPNQQSVMDVIYSIAKNDKLRCVPRLLCEVTSDTLSRGRQFNLPNLPININMESIIGILSTIDAASGSPLTTFAKAALLGYTSKGNSDYCLSAYPRCPRDADRLVQYLNNYNGGFFRFFNGINPPQSSAGYGLLNYAPNLNGYNPYNNQVRAEQRIQNKPVQFVPNNYVSASEGVIFPTNDISPEFNLNNKSPKSLAFPTDNLQSSFNAFRKPKELPFSINHYYSDEFDFQKVLPNHKATPMIFPDRTGTGELRLDAEELNENYKQSQYYPQNNNVIHFNPTATNEAFYYGIGGFGGDNYRNNRALVSFPV